MRSKPIWLDAGLITELPLRKASPSALLVAENTIFHKGYWQKRPGFVYYNTPYIFASGCITMVASFRQKIQTYLVLCNNFGFYWYIPETDESFDITGDVLTAPSGELPDYTTFGEDLIVTNGSDNTQVWSGQSDQITWLTLGGVWSAATIPWNDVTLMPVFTDLTNAYKARYCQSYMGRLFLFDLEISGTRYRTALAWSSYRDATDWSSYDSDVVYLDDNPEPITGAGICKGSMLVFKRRSVYAMNFIGGATLFEIVLKSSDTGTTSHATIKSGEDNIFFCGDMGAYEYDLYTFTEISAPVRNQFIQSMHPEYKNRMHATLDRIRGLYIVYYCSLKSIGMPDRAFVYDYRNKKCSFWDLPFVAPSSGEHQESGYNTWQDMSHPWISESGSWFSQAWIKEAEISLLAECWDAAGTKSRIRQLTTESADHPGGWVSKDPPMDPFTTKLRLAYLSASEEQDDISQVKRLGLYARRNGATISVRHGRSDDGETILWNPVISKVLGAGEEDHFVDIGRAARFHVFDIEYSLEEDFGLAGFMLEIQDKLSDTN